MQKMPVGAVPFPFGICRICKDKATGVHYGVTTCEGCKGFFKRSITRGDKYKCFFGGDCDLTPKNRNRCKSCRFKKCLEVGMSVEAVRMGRIPKVDKEKALAVFHKSGSNYNNLEIEVAMTDSGTYDFKINPKENENAPGQTGLGNRISGKEIYSGQVSYQSCNSQAMCDSEKYLGAFDPQSKRKGTFENEASLLMSGFNGQLQTEEFQESFSGFDPNSRLYNTKNMNTYSTETCSGDRASTRCETISSYDILTNGENTYSAFNPENIPVSKFYSARQTSCDNVKATEGVCVAGNNSSKSDAFRNVQRWHSYDNTLKTEPVPTRNDAAVSATAGFRLESYQAHGTSSAEMLPQSLVPCSSRDSDIPPMLCSPGKQASGSSLDMNTSYNEQNENLRLPFQSDFREEFQQLVDKENQFCKNLSNQCNPTGHILPEHTFESASENFSQHQNSSIDSELKSQNYSEEMEKFAQCRDNSYSDCVNISQEECSLKQRKFSTDSHEGTVEHDSQHGKTNFSGGMSPMNPQSFEKFSSPGSVISNEGSGSSCHSGYSPAVIQLLLDQVLEFDQGDKLTEKLKSKFKQIKADQLVVQRVLNLVSEATERVKRIKRGNCESEWQLEKLPENKLESMNRFLRDLHNNFSSSEAPLLKKKRAAETLLYESFENLDMERSKASDAIVQGLNSHIVRSDRNHFVSQSKQVLPNPNANIFSKRNVTNMNGHSQSLEFSVFQNFENDTLPIQSSSQGISSNTGHVSSRHVSTNQNIHIQSQNVSGGPESWQDSQVSSNNQFSLTLVSPTSSKNTEADSAKMTCRKQVDAYDETVSSTNINEENAEKVEDILNTIDCMNLGVKILNRFKPEHREKIRLYKQGQLHLRVMTDSDEDCAAIYQKLMEGIPGLNDRILGFCDSIPGFLDLCKEDREKLIKRSYYDMWTLSYSEYFQNGESFWILPTGEIYSASAMRKILNDEMVDTIMKFADEFNSLNLTDLETAIFAAVRLTLTSGVDIEDKAKVEKLHRHLLKTLMFEMERNHPGSHAQLLLNIFHLVPLIESVNRIQSEIIANFSLSRFKKEGATGEGS